MASVRDNWNNTFLMQKQVTYLTFPDTDYHSLQSFKIENYTTRNCFFIHQRNFTPWFFNTTQLKDISLSSTLSSVIFGVTSIQGEGTAAPNGLRF